ncbi:MAG: hypothetical protein VB100_12420 [Angelakisella sp.]|nr:hypothetical protein [Angelakisella sp.]
MNCFKKLQPVLVVIILILLLPACAPPSVSGAQNSEVSSSKVSNPESHSESLPQIEESSSETSISMADPVISSSQSEAAVVPDNSSVSAQASAPVIDPRIDEERDRLRSFLQETLWDGQYTSFYFTDDQLGLGIAAPDLDVVKAAVEAFGERKIKVEYRQTVYSKAVLDVARKELRELQEHQRQLGDELIMNVAGYEMDGFIHITIHQMHSALEEFLRQSNYKGCYAVNVTGGDPIVNPNT